jgi:hypothetical protein
MSLSDLPASVILFFILAVLALIGIVTWLGLKSKRSGGAASRKRQLRLAVMDVARVYGRRRLVIVRRDNVEHLLIIGGQTDLVVETNIVRGNAAVACEAAPARTPVAETLLARPRPTSTAREYGERRQQRENMAASSARI